MLWFRRVEVFTVEWISATELDRCGGWSNVTDVPDQEDVTTGLQLPSSTSFYRVDVIVYSSKLGSLSNSWSRAHWELALRAVEVR